MRKLPRRHNGRQVRLQQMPGDRHMSLGVSYTADDPESVRHNSIQQWHPNSPSPRETGTATSQGIREELNQREQTLLSYELPAEQQAIYNRMQTNEPKKQSGRKNNKGGITISL